jgi:aryl-alcohol dehydrogenase-like predicted oxidoreductase
MRSRDLGGRTVGEIGLGCMGMTYAYTTAGHGPQDPEGVLREAVGHGVTLIDTADVYGPFTSEELVGTALRGLRDSVLLATKAGLVLRDTADGPRLVRDGRPEHIHRAVRESLRRLRTDHIDLYQLHRVDENVPLAESWDAMAALVAEGLVREIGLSDVRPDQIAAAHAIHRVATVQNELSLWKRDDDVVDWTGRHGVGFIAYAPLGRGFLTGRFESPDDLADNDLRRWLPRFSANAMASDQRDILTGMRTVAARHQATLGQVALAWVLAQGAHVVPIPGTKRAGYLRENVAAGAIRLTPDELRMLSEQPAGI